MATVAAMVDEAGARLQCKVLALQLGVWGIAGVVLLVGLAIVAVVWAIVSGRDVVAIVGDVLTFFDARGRSGRAEVRRSVRAGRSGHGRAT